VRVYDCPKDRDTTGIAMELLTGGSLRDLLRTAQEGKRRLGIEAITRFALQAAGGLGAAHQVGIVHRDVKPANLLLNTETDVKVADFGVVLALEGATWLTGLGHRIGTPAYMSPEQCQGERVHPPSDVYSLGVTLYELATGRLPFEEEAGSPFALMLKHIQEPAPDPRKLRRNLPNWLAWIILKCLDKTPEQRYADGEALAEAITAGPHEPVLAGAPPELEKPTWRVNTVAIREQLQRLPQRAIVSWACRCARRVQHLSSDPRLGRTIALAEATLGDTAAPESQESLSAALQRIQRLRTTSLKAAYTDGSTVIAEAASHAALAAAAASSCAASRCAADAAADAAFAAQSAVTAMEVAKEPVTTFWQCAQRDFQVLLAARLGPDGTIGKPIPPGFWAEK
jgi:serine/threonine protein kinase